MTSAEQMTNPSQNLLYTKLRSRFCPEGDKTIGERMLQASTQMKTVNTDVFSEIDTASNSAVYDAVVSPARHAHMLRDFFAVLLAVGIFVCLAVSIFRLAADRTASEELHKNTPFSVTTVSENDMEKQSVLFIGADEYGTVTEKEATEHYKNTYLAFSGAFGD